MKSKSIKEDIGLIDEILELCKNLTSIESHSFGSYLSSGEEKWLRLSQEARKMRTKYLSIITKKIMHKGGVFPNTFVSH